MERGISFEIPNKYGSLLGEILMPFETAKFIWRTGGEESYLLKGDELGELLFKDEINWLEGRHFKKLIEENNYYLIFTDLKAYPKNKQLDNIKTYEDYLKSECQLVLLIVDSAYVTIYCKDNESLKRLYENAKNKGFDHLQYITDKNDSRANLTVW
ncbi:DUF2691 family protein [Metabacillus sp. B2-18]|uniref:DUF2691 family protein n=1 Tax=Metabacillus sp. B2-18 TaxID=2897333 RepID=UPI001E4A7337|nr:DUF2691 family protein [Metabacillus sp. B2-18]UGB28761.1 DUF2691 family protein [Metabacillus sp. B2-18]